MFWPSAIFRRRGSDLSQRKCGAIQLDYINETRGFVMEPGFPSWAGSCETNLVKQSIHLCRLLAFFLIVGLVIAPLSARANGSAMASMASASMSGDMADMSDDMPCCPEKSVPMDCADCPLMAICIAKTLQAQPSAGVAEIQSVTLRMLLPVSDPAAESLGLLPPPKPPRSLVRPA